jgi:hypothetical protein
MRKYLRMNNFRWPKEQPNCESLYFDALNSQRNSAFERLYRDHPDLQNTFGQAISDSIEALLCTGADSQGEVNALWIPKRRNA